MGRGLDHCIHCAFHVLFPNMLHDCVLCVVLIIYMVKSIWKRGTIGLENITLGVRKKNE